MWFSELASIISMHRCDSESGYYLLRVIGNVSPSHLTKTDHTILVQNYGYLDDHSQSEVENLLELVH